MSKEEEPPEFDIPDDDDDRPPQKSIFEKPPGLKKALQKKQSEVEDDQPPAEGQKETEGEEEPSGEEDTGGEYFGGGPPRDEEEGEEEGEEGGTVVDRPPPSAGEESEGEPSETAGSTSSIEASEGQYPPKESSAEEGQSVEDEVKQLQGEILEDVFSGKVAKKGGEDKSDMSIPEQMLEEALPDEDDEEDMSPEDIARSIITEIVTGKKPKGRGKGAKGVAEGVIEEAAFGDSAEAIAGGVVSEIVPSPKKIAQKVVSDIISPQYQVKKIIDRMMPGGEAREIAEKMVSIMVAGGEDIDEDVTQYIWEGPCSSSSTSLGKSEEGSEKFDRENYIERYKNLCKEKFIIGRKNIFLQKKVHDYYKRKMLIRYFESIEDDQKAEAKYIKNLRVFEKFVDEDRDRRAVISMELVDLEKRREESDIQMRDSLKILIDTEREHGIGLINEMTGKVLLDKTVERMLNRQKETVGELVVILQKYIRIRDFLSSKEKALVQLETIGVDCYLRDYEQLQMENQSYSDKIEERDEELMRLRHDATASMQILAHVREKANATTNNIYELHESLESVMIFAGQIREHIGVLKKIRERLRMKTNKMKVDAGLLVQHRLIKDFQDSIDKLVRLENDIENLKLKFSRRNCTLSNIRKSLSLQRRMSTQSLQQRQRDYQIFKELLFDKRRHMPDDSELRRPHRSASIYASQYGSDEEKDGEEGDQARSSKVLKKSRPNFFPRKKFDSVGRYFK